MMFPQIAIDRFWRSGDVPNAKVPMSVSLGGGKQIPSTRKALEFKGSAFGKFQAGAGDKVSDHPRYQYLVRSRLRHNSRGSVHRNATDILSPNFDLAGVQACAERQADVFRGGAESERAPDGAAGTVERRQNAVACAFDQNAAVVADDLLGKLIVDIQQITPAPVANFDGIPG
jgi:hypothetical protein